MIRIPDPYQLEDPFARLGLTSEQELTAWAPALAQRPAELQEAPGLIRALLHHPWCVPTQGLADEPHEAWLAYRLALAAHRTLWEKEAAGHDQGHHDAWVHALESVLRAMGAPGFDPLITTLTEAVGLTAGAALLEAKADFLVDCLLEPAARLVTEHPARFEVEAAHLQTVRTLGELQLRLADHARLLRRVLRSAGILWLEVERPERAQALLEELLQLEPGQASTQHFLVRCKLLQAIVGIRKLSFGAPVAPIIARLEDLIEEAPHQWEVRTQLADLFLAQSRQHFEERRASDGGEAVLKALVADIAWPPCAAMAGDVEGSMHESRLMGGLGGGMAPGMREQLASEQLKTSIRAGFSRGEMYLSRPRPYRMYETWPQAAAAQLWFDLGLPLDGGTFPGGCVALAEALAEAPPLQEAEPPWTPELREAIRRKVPELTDAMLDGPVSLWARVTRFTLASLGAPVSARDLLFLHRARDRSLAAPPLGDGPWYRPVLGFGLRETKEGLEVEGVKAESPASEAGLREKDHLLRVRGFSCPNTNRALFALLGWQPGDPLDLRIRRQNKLHALWMQPTEHKLVDRLPQAEFKRRVEKLLNIRFDANLKVLSVPRIGLFCQVKEGDQLLRVDGIPVRNSTEFEQTLRTVDMGQFVVMTVLRAGEPRLAKVITIAFKE